VVKLKRDAWESKVFQITGFADVNQVFQNWCSIDPIGNLAFRISGWWLTRSSKGLSWLLV
jgi:hypothetical protein